MTDLTHIWMLGEAASLDISDDGFFWTNDMPLATATLARPVEYFILRGVTSIGRTIGVYADRPIADTIADEHGRRFVYAGIASRRWNGQFDVDALRPGEFILQPGLVYRLERQNGSSRRSLFHKK
jgi:hypothetical protein